MIWTVLGFAWLCIGIAGGSLANRKNRNKAIWFIICIISGLLGLLILSCSKTLPYDEELGYAEESDQLGVWVLILCIFAQILSLHYIYNLF